MSPTLNCLMTIAGHLAKPTKRLSGPSGINFCWSRQEGRRSPQAPIVEKLHRESIRLSQIQDIAGCRVIVVDIVEQEKVLASLRAAFPRASTVDRRLNPSFGYRAVHVISRTFGQLVEIQVRTSLQHLWAEFSEKFSDVYNPSIKYGGGRKEDRNMLAKVSDIVAKIENMEKREANPREQILDEKENKAIKKAEKEQIVFLKREVAEILSEAIITLENKERSQQ